MHTLFNTHKKSERVFGFEKKHSYNQRCDESKNILTKYPDRIPIICEQSYYNMPRVSIDRNKYLVPMDLTFGQFMFVIRKKLKLHAEQAIFLYVNDSILVNNSTLLSDVYNEHKKSDNFLYIAYAFESTFG